MGSENGPEGLCQYDCVEIGFGCLPPMPAGYSVWWHGEHEHYQGHGPDEWESAITVNRFHARAWCIERAAASAGEWPGDD